MNLTILTLNCYDRPFSLYRKVRLTRIALEIIKLKPDIICFQEVNLAKTAVNLAKLFGDAGYNVFFQPAKMINRGGLLTASLLPIIDQQYQRFSTQGFPLSLQFSDRLLGKGYHLVRLSLGDKKITLINTHLVSVFRTQSFLQNQARESQLAQLTSAVKEISNQIAIVAGDLNFSPQNNLCKQFVQNTGLNDALTDKNWITVSVKNTHWKKFARRDIDERMDYIFLANNIAILDRQLIFQTPVILDSKHPKPAHLSDHFGILLSAQLGRLPSTRLLTHLI